MEQHPVPQNVTTFQFRLIGDMTLKQFGYLCAGALLSFIAYKLPLPFIFTWPLAFAFAFMGVGFAFIPIEERPMDVWVFSFFKSVYNPTQYIWTKEAPIAEPTKSKPAAKSATLPGAARPPTANPAPVKAPASGAPQAVLSDIFQKPAPAKPAAVPPSGQAMHASVVTAQPQAPSLFSWLADLWNPKQSAQPASAPAMPTQPPLRPVTGYKPAPVMTMPVSPVQQAEEARVHEKMTQLESSLRSLQEQLATKNVTSDRIVELQGQLTDALKQKTVMEDELVALKRQMMPRNTSVASPAVSGQQQSPQAPVKNQKSVVTVINTQDAATKAGLPRLTNVSNVITGLVRDNESNFLPGILVTVTNNEGIPMRALKTNKLGQFAASTPLASGVYFVEIEDPRGRFTFSRVQITLNGAVVPAIEVIAKSEKQLTREKLAQEIFGKNTM